ncbi:MAG: sugar ABC transporter permease [Alphaproteobacteria bacterium]|nr:sugar ABC transporter permease [Alphaproteobacteria bacterium]
MSALGRLIDAPFEAVQRAIGAARMPYVFVAPNLLVFGIFVAAPMILNVWYAVTGGIQLMPGERPYVGASNFAELLDCDTFGVIASCRQDRFWRAVANTAWFVAFQVVGLVAVSLVTALILNRRMPWRGFFRAVFFYPVLLSPVVVALIWKWVLQPDGVLNALIVAGGGARVPFLLDPSWAFSWTVVISIWAHMGFYTLILLAGLQAIPADLYEAAEMDGTAHGRVFWRITLPLLMPNMVVVLVLGLIRAVQSFDEIFVLTGGGPGTATQYIVQYIYETAFANQTHILGLAAAASILVGGVLMVLTLLQLAATAWSKGGGVGR